MTENRTKEKSGTEGEEMVWEKDYMDMGQNGIKKKQEWTERVWVEDRDDYGSKWNEE